MIELTSRWSSGLLLACSCLLVACGDSGSTTTSAMTDTGTSADTDASTTAGGATETSGVGGSSSTGATMSGSTSTNSSTSSSTSADTGTTTSAATGTTAAGDDCDALLQDVLDALAMFGVCGTEMECDAPKVSNFCGPNGEGGCYLFLNFDDDLTGWDAATQAYADAGCPQADCDCGEPMIVSCVEGRCQG